MNLTVQILITDEKCIETIEPIKKLTNNILVANVGYNDIKPPSNVVYFNFKDSKDRSKVRNFLLNQSKNEWNLCLNQDEFLFDNIFDINNYIKNKNNLINFNILRDNVITKEIRLINTNSKYRFENQLFESIYSEDYYHTDFTIFSKSNNLLNINLINYWKNINPIDKNILYYEIIYFLQNKNYNKFIDLCEHYFSIAVNDISTTMLRYYFSFIKLYYFNDIKSSINNIINCLIKQPLMAEFWCLLGDNYCQLGKFDKAKNFYENALILGSKRKNNDAWPIDIPKYKEYPNKMIEICNKHIKD